MKSLVVVLLLLAGNVTAAGSDYPSPAHEHTSPVQGSRFEVMQSPLAAKWTFRLDRFTGRVWLLVKNKDDDNMWEEMTVLDLPKAQGPPRPRFQLFTSGLAARHTFMLDTDSGKSWLVVITKRKNAEGGDVEVAVWQPFAE